MERKTLLDRIGLQLQPIGEVTYEYTKDGSWLNMELHGKHLNIVFDKSGQKIESVGVYQDILQVVDQKKIF